MDDGTDLTDSITLSAVLKEQRQLQSVLTHWETESRQKLDGLLTKINSLLGQLNMASNSRTDKGDLDSDTLIKEQTLASEFLKLPEIQMFLRQTAKAVRQELDCSYDGISEVENRWDEITIPLSSPPKSGPASVPDVEGGESNAETAESVRPPDVACDEEPKPQDLRRVSGKVDISEVVKNELATGHIGWNLKEYRSASVHARKAEAIRSISQVRTPDHEGLTFEWLVLHPMFSAVAAVVILCSAFCTAMEVEILAGADATPMWLQIMNHTCSFYFLVEVVLRLLGLRLDFFLGEETKWNLFDLCLVLLSIVEVSMDASTSSAGGEENSTAFSSAVKPLKMFRIARIFRVFRFFRSLALLALMIVDSMRELVWASIMVFILIFFFAVSLTTQTSEWLKRNPGEYVQTGFGNRFSEDAGTPRAGQVIFENYGSLLRTTYTLFQVMLGGVSWREVCDPLFSMDWVSPVLLIAYIAFALLAAMNIITGVFVDNAMQSAALQRDFLIQKEIDMKEKFIVQLKEMFAVLDQDGTGTVDKYEMRRMFEDETLSAYFRTLGFATTHAEQLFQLLDEDGDGQIATDEFLDGCLRMQGPARNMDVHMMMMESRMFRKKIAAALATGRGSTKTCERGAPVVHEASH
eukprot:TRINITY_DN3506_c0_g1_i1.p1 TRINITY_DN3506_c0_g1~~TRINITY_DN3506_c0_g1_i1.p1  ORF type:complete len:636 (-),score=134.91 TRINITY_DN3506_c0_g1_i1:51-1958(-)